MRIERPVPADFSLEAERIRIGGEQQLDRRGVEADAVIEAVDFIFGIDALDGHHRHQDLDFRNLRRVAGEKRLDIMRFWALDDEIDPIARNVHARQLVHDLVDLRDDDAALEGGRLDNHRRVLGIGPGIEIAGGVGRLGADQTDARREIDEIAPEKFEIGMDRADGDAVFADQLGQPSRLRPGEGKIEF